MTPKIYDKHTMLFGLALFFKTILLINLFLREGGWGRNNKGYPWCVDSGWSVDNLTHLDNAFSLVFTSWWSESWVSSTLYSLAWNEGGPSRHFIDGPRESRLSLIRQPDDSRLSLNTNSQTARSRWVPYSHLLCPFIENALKSWQTGEALTTRVCKRFQVRNFRLKYVVR